MIGIDWGTSNFRAYRLGDHGEILERRSFRTGISRLPEGGFGQTLLSHIGDWIDGGERHILMSGMVGSRQGWMQTEYVACPVRLEDLVSHVVRIPFAEAEVLLIPGVSGNDADGLPELMRGEETELMGLIGADERSIVCLPGTHSKWVDLDHGTIIGFNTCMTGEVFAALQQATILAQDTDAIDDGEAFLRGVARSADKGGLLHHLFSVRTLMLAGSLRAEASASYISGLLIGHEVRSMMTAGDAVHLAGATSLCSLYGRAIVACGGSFSLEQEDAAARGLALIAGRLQWT